ncbi:MAG: protein-disulfide reductase DsbD domain-containing protein [Rhodothermales bacterium]
MKIFRPLANLRTGVVRWLFTGLCLGLGLPSLAQAQDVGPATDYVSWTVTAVPSSVAAGETARLYFRASIDAGWKMYALDSPKPSRAVSVRFDELPAGLAVQGDMQQDGAKQGYDPNFKIDVSYFEKEAELWTDVAVAPDAAPGSVTVGGKINFMICNDRMCLPPVNVPAEVHLDITSPANGRQDAAFAPDAIGNTQVPQDVSALLQWAVSADPTTIAPGESTRVQFTATIAEGWKLYALDTPRPSLPTTITFDALPVGFIQEGDPEQPEPEVGYDPNFKMDVRYFEGTAVLGAVLRLGERATSGLHELGGTIKGQICSDTLCIPFREAFTLALTVVGGTEATPTITAASDFNGVQAEGGIWGFLILAIGAGFAALLTPCVFPMIPLTVSYFTKHSHNRSEAVRMALVYGLAIVVTFTGLGVLMALIVGASGAQMIATNPWVNLFIGGIFVLFALSLLGLFDLRLPSGLMNYFNRQSNEQKGYLGVLFMGFTLTLVSFSCTAPFVGGLLAATTFGSWSYPVLGMVMFSATFSLPFVFFALFPRALSSLPRSGSWMNVVKVVLGFVELAAAIKFLSNADLVWGWGLISRTLAIAVCVVIFFLSGLYLIGKLRLTHEPAVEHIGVGRLLAAIAFFGLSLYMLPGLMGAPLNKLDAYLPPRQYDDVSLITLLQRSGSDAVAHNEEAWIVDDIEAAFAQAEAEAKPVFIDFSGYTCTNCRDMEANVFTRPEIAERFERDFVLLRLYTDGPRDIEFQQYQLELTQTVALPTYAIVNPFEQDAPILKVSGVVDTDRFVAFLDQGTSSFQEKNLARSQ